MSESADACQILDHLDRNDGENCRNGNACANQNQAPSPGHDAAHLPLPSASGERDANGPGYPGFGSGNPKQSLPRKSTQVHFAVPPRGSVITGLV
jgi:hypothetical protein